MLLGVRSWLDIHSQEARRRWKWKHQHQRYDVTIAQESGFGGIVWSRSVETSNEEEVERALKDALPVEDTGMVEAAGEKAERLGVFVEVLKYWQRFKEVG